MTIDEFLKDYAEGYLFEDLTSMSAIQLEAPRDKGACGYSMISATLAGIELLGGLLSGAPFQRDPNGRRVNLGNQYFTFYWDNCMAARQPGYRGYASLFYNLLRHGIAHTFLAKSNLIVTKETPAEHLRRNGEGFLVVDAVQLYIDFKASYFAYVRPVLDNPVQDGGLSTRANMQNRLNEMIADYQSDSCEQFSRLPEGLPLEGTYTAGSLLTATHSPTGGTISPGTKTSP